MSIFAIADLHLAFSIPDKSMEFFGESWHRYAERTEEAWRASIKADDLVLIPGDISWAKDAIQAQQDLAWIDSLPGTKLLLRGNHDYWWGSLSQVKKILPPSMHAIHNTVFNWKDISIGGSRLWDTDEYTFDAYINYVANPRIKKLQEPENPEEEEKIFVRELARLEMSLKELNQKAGYKIAMTHYPPISATLQPSRASLLLEKYNVQTCVFGHLHSVKRELPMFGEANGIHYHLVAADYLQFKPLQIL